MNNNPPPLSNEDSQAFIKEQKEKRNEVLEKLRSREITFREMVLLPEADKNYELIDRFTAVSILSSMNGWDKSSAQRALASYGIDINSRVRSIKKRSDYIDTMDYLCARSSQTWQRRITAPVGWPWFGNLLATLEQLDEESLPKEIIKATRYLTDDEKRHAQAPYIETDEEPTAATTGRSDDGLDDLFGGLDDEGQSDDAEEYFSREAMDELDRLLGSD